MRPREGMDASSVGGGLEEDEEDDDIMSEEEDRQQDSGSNSNNSNTRSNGMDPRADTAAESNTAANGDSTTTASPANKKRRVAAPGSRSVAKLTPEQLAKKRANDREAQRAIRERQKLRQAQYEREIRDLKSQQPYLELQAVIKQKEALEHELVQVKQTLAAIVSLAQPVLGANQPQGLALAQQPVMPVAGREKNAYLPAPSPASSTQADQADHHLTGQPIPPRPPSLSLRMSTPAPSPSPGPATAPVAPSSALDTPSPQTAVLIHPPYPYHQAYHQPQQHQHPPPAHLNPTNPHHPRPHDPSPSSDRLAFSFLLDATQTRQLPRIPTGIEGAQDTPQYRHLPMKHDWTANTSDPTAMLMQGPVPVSGSVPLPPQTPAHSPPPTTTTTTTISAITTPFPPNTPDDSSTIPVTLMPTPINCPPTCPLDCLLLDVIRERRQQAADGLPSSQVLGPRYPSVSSLLNPDRARHAHPLSRVFTDIIARFPNLSGLPEQVAILHVMFMLVRWQIEPTPQNYERIPHWFRPRPLQINTSHPAWIEHIPFPAMRDRLCEDYTAGTIVPFENFFIPFTTTFKINWEYEDLDVLLAGAGRGGDEVVVNPVFERHIGRLENWTLGEAFERAFPRLAGTYNLKS